MNERTKKRREDADKKPRSESLLKNLPFARQEEIWERLTVKTADWPDTSYRAVRKWLADDGLPVSQTMLCGFFGWFPLRLQQRADEQTTDAIRLNLKEEVKNITDEELDNFGQKTFGLLAIRHKDLNGFVTVRGSRTKAILETAKLKLREHAEARADKRLELDREKLALLQKKIEQSKAVVQSTTLSPEEQRRRLKEILK